MADLTARGREVITGFPDVLVPVADRWLHCTVQMVAGRSATTATTAQLGDLAERARDVFAQVPAFTSTVGSHMASRAGTLLDLGPDEPWDRLTQAANEAIEAVFGAEALTYQGPPPHLTTGYAIASTDSGPITSRLRRTRPTHAPWHVTDVQLVDVTQDATRHEYRWRTLATFPLGRSQG